MQQIINVILKNRNFYIYLLLLLFSVLFLQNNSPFHKSQFRQISLGISGSMLSLRNSYQSYFDLRAKTQALQLENLKLRSQLVELEQKGSIDSSQTTLASGFSLIPARTVKNSIGGVRNFLILNRGRRDSITADMGVISNNGVVGIINQVNNKYASAVSVLHRDVKINAKLKQNDAFGSLFWPGKEINKMILSDIPTINSISIGDTIVTGGMSAYFPKNIPLGRISNFSILPSKRYYEIEVILFTNFSTLDHVYIVRNLDKPLLDELTK